jgi:hypothetical protein
VLVYDFNQHEEYSAMDLNAKEIKISTFLFRKEGDTRLYIWNPRKVEGEIVIESIDIEKVKYHPLMSNQR